MRILYTAFKGKNNSSYQLLSGVPREKLFLTNSFEGLKRDIMNISDTYDLVLMFGLDTNIKDMARIECAAEYDGMKKTTKIDCEAICKHMEENDIQCIVSEIPTKYLCNAAYYHMLHKTDGNAAFIHIPSSKNMSETMMEKIVNCMEEMEKCAFFCEIINKQSPAHIVYEDSLLISFLDIEPIHEGHVLIVPKQHVDSIDKLPDDTLTNIMSVAKKMVVALKEIYGNEGYSIMQNGGKYCDFGHAHFHVFPRYDNDGFGWTYPKGESEYSERVAEKLRGKL